MGVVRLSRYEFADVHQDAQGHVFLDVVPPVPKSVILRGAAQKVLRDGDTLWSLAWLAYQQILDREQDIRPTSFFDVIADANDVVNPIAPLSTYLQPKQSVFFLPTLEVLLGDVRVPPPAVRVG